MTRNRFRCAAAKQRRDERGATATEYALLVGFIAIVITFGVGAFGSALNAYYEALGDWVEAVLGP